jgi:Cu/Ag efflux protein CusF
VPQLCIDDLRARASLPNCNRTVSQASGCRPQNCIVATNPTSGGERSSCPQPATSNDHAGLASQAPLSPYRFLTGVVIMLKRNLISSIFLVISLAMPLAAVAQSGHDAHHVAAAATAPESALSEGVVRKIDKKAGEVTIAHGPLVNLGMPKMTMTFKLKSPALIEGVKEGSNVRFVADNVNGELTIVALYMAK